MYESQDQKMDAFNREAKLFHRLKLFYWVFFGLSLAGATVCLIFLILINFIQFSQSVYILLIVISAVLLLGGVTAVSLGIAKMKIGNRLDSDWKNLQASGSDEELMIAFFSVHREEFITKCQQERELSAKKAQALVSQSPDYAAQIADAQVQAKQGDPEAMMVLFLATYYGAGLPQDDKQAFAWAKAMSDLKFPDGIYALSNCYLSGVGTETDIKLFWEYLEEAAKLGSQRAIEDLQMYSQN